MRERYSGRAGLSTKLTDAAFRSLRMPSKITDLCAKLKG